MSSNPLVFISHAHIDKHIVDVLTSQIADLFAGGVETFASTIDPGDNWFKVIQDNLMNARAVIVLLTPNSINRHWVWFEVGASWSYVDEKRVKMFPLSVGLTREQIPDPLRILQTVNLNNETETRQFFATLIGLFGIGKIKYFRPRRFSDLSVTETPPLSTEIEAKLEKAFSNLIAHGALTMSSLELLSASEVMTADTVRKLRTKIEEKLKKS